MLRFILLLIAHFVAFTPASLAHSTSPRIWIDTDASCGARAHAEVDDCLALAMLARANAVPIAAISSIYGNASRPDVDRTLEGLLPLWPGDPPLLYSGAIRARDCRNNLAANALVRALRGERLRILALGPMTNIACALKRDPHVAKQIDSIVAVMGAEPGHLFHPAEGAPGAIFFGHGVMVRDLNAELDPEAVAIVLKSRAPLVLTPYALGRRFAFDEGMREALALRTPLQARVARDARGWLQTWRSIFGRDGFYPFDALAALYVLAPETIQCARERAAVARDAHIMGGLWGSRRLLIGKGVHEVLWCPSMYPGAAESLRRMLLA